MSDLIGCLPVPCTTCPYRRDVPSGVWDAAEYAKLALYDRETFQQPPALFMCHQNNDGLCTGWLQSHANRHHTFDLLALRLNFPKLAPEVSQVALAEPAVKLFTTGAAAARHGLWSIQRPGRKARQAMDRITRKRRP